MTVDSHSAFVCVIFLCYLITNTEQCLQVGNGNGPPSFRDYEDEDEQVEISRYHQAIIPSYGFMCCGNITEWRVDLNPGGGRDNGRYTLNLQVWRPSPTADDSTGTGNYNLVGNNRFTSVSLSNGGAIVITPSSSDYIQFRSGDVLGFHVESARNDNAGLVVVTAGSFNGERVWHASVSSVNENCPVSVGSSGALNTLVQGAPVIEIDTETYNCPQIVPTPPPCPTTTSIMSATRTSSSIPSDTSATLQPTSVPFISTEPATTATGRMSTESLSTESTPGDVVTDDSTKMELVPSNPTNQSTDNNILPTEQISTDNRVPSTGGGDSTAVIAAVVLAVLVVLILAVLLSVIVGVVLSKRRSKNFGDTHSSLHMGISNKVYGQNFSVNDPTYDYVEEKFPTVEYTMSGKKVLTGDKNGRAYHEAGPSTSNKTVSDAGIHIYEVDVLYHQPNTSEVWSKDPVYEDPSVSPGLINYEVPEKQIVFENAGIYVPTDSERKQHREDAYQAKNYNNLEFFVEDPVYWAPASTMSALYSQLASKKYREIQRDQIIVGQTLGSGEFGQVCKAFWSLSGGTKELAVKTLRQQLPEEEKVRFLQEAAIMGQFSHPNVVKLYGVITIGDPVMICIELMANGDLRHYLCSIIPDEQSTKELQMQFLRFSKQIAAGMNYLADKSFIHRDLAARNVLLDESLTCKIGDFGLARDLVYETYYTSKTKGGKLPIKWMAPEALFYKKYSTYSDVWSYGMVLFEIWSVGKKPFSKISNSEVLKQINTGYNQPPPPGCPRAIYQLMVDCWNPVHSKRPSFSDIGRYLSSSNDLLLQWVEEEDTATRSRELGAPLSEAETLYKDLQNVYIQLH